MTKQQLWDAVLGELELSVSRANFSTWLKQTFVATWNDTEIVIAVPNTFAQAYLERKYHRTILQVVERVTDRGVLKIAYRVETNRRLAEVPEVPAEQPKLSPAEAALGVAQQGSGGDTDQTPASDHAASDHAGLNPRYTFEMFIVGKGNELAHAASQAVTHQLGSKYNPLFVYGGVGLGKTHIAQAIGHSLLRRRPKLKVLYCSSEKFTNDFIRSLREQWTERFRSIYRTVDLLIIDDIQFIAGKEQTQEEFFHTFNALHQRNRQIVITSDRPPKSIPALEERLISRFEWGMIADISTPDLETRMAILQSKAQEKKFPITPDVVQYLATHIQSNVRELEGALNKLIAHFELQRLEPTLEVVKQLLSSMNYAPQRSVMSIKDLIEEVASFYNVTVPDLIGACRKKELVVPRQITMFLMREELDTSYPSIGNEIGGRDHTTAMHAYQKIKNALDSNPRIRDEVNLIKQRIYNTPSLAS
ncbi:MAG: chromosomal replication initiator protein DnaA [bacterium]|nr:chromosomal replication initiator protein DnaA [bacterium]